MGMPKLLEPWTREQVLALPEDGMRHELVDGVLLVSPSPRPLHQVGVWTLNRILDAWVRKHRLGLTGLAPCDLDLRSGQLLQPDLFVIPLDDRKVPHRWDEFGIPTLVAEVVSPSTARQDRGMKRVRYQRSGVDEYWIVDLDTRTVERWRPGSERPEVFRTTIAWRPPGASDPLRIDLLAYFAEVWGEV